MKSIITTDRAPLPVGPYSQAVRTGHLLFVSGQVAINPQTKELVTGDIRAETEQVLLNIGAILEAAGASFDHVVKASVFVTDMSQYATINEVYARFFTGGRPPARELVQVAALPLGVHVEISVIASIPS